MNEIILFGAGGHAKSVWDSIRCLEQPKIAAFIDKSHSAKWTNLIAPTILEHDIQCNLSLKGKSYFIAIGDNRLRRQVYDRFDDVFGRFMTILDSTAVVSVESSVADGVFIGKQAIINIDVNIGVGTIINTGAIIEHDVSVGAFSHIGPGAVICGQVIVGANTFVGAGAVILPNITIGDDVIIGAGSIVTKDIDNGDKCYGNPCRKR